MKVTGIGVILETAAGTYLLQERDHRTSVHPGRYAPFGGGLEEGEDVYECARRELHEELALDLDVRRLTDLGLFASHGAPGVGVHLFLAKGVDIQSLRLQEGKSIVELTRDEALEHEKVTDFTKEVLRSL